MELFDSHAHLNDDVYKGNVEEVLDKCKENNIKYIVSIGYNEENSRYNVSLANKYESVYATVGVHPEEYKEGIKLSFINELSKNQKVVAVGEIGLDYHYEDVPKDIQKELFINQINIANSLNLPVVIHNREADMDMLNILKSITIKNGFIMHCFSSSVEVAKEILKLGGYISLSGTITFKNARKLIDVAKIIPENRLLIETDCPYLAPEPYRGRLNNPSLIINTAEKIANIREISLEDLSIITTKNAKKIYNII